jgi:hypothetical protein
MNTKQENKFSMYLAVQAICNDLLAIFALLPQFTNWFTQFGTVIKNIKTYSEAQELDYKGKTESKGARKQTLIDQTMEIIRRVVAYATVNDLHDLKEKVNYSASDLKRSPDTALRTICQVVYEQATSVFTELGTYGVTQVMLDDQQLAIDDYFKEVTAPREGIISRKNATVALLVEFKTGDEILTKRLDKLVEMLKITNPEAYNSYMNARIIVDLGKGRKKGEYMISGKVIDFATGMPLSGVTVAVVGTTIVVITGVDGLFNIPVKAMGNYVLRAEKNGYHELIEEEVFVGLEPLDLTLELEVGQQEV